MTKTLRLPGAMLATVLLLGGSLSFAVCTLEEHCGAPIPSRHCGQPGDRAAAALDDHRPDADCCALAATSAEPSERVVVNTPRVAAEIDGLQLGASAPAPVPSPLTLRHVVAAPVGGRELLALHSTLLI